MHNLKIIAILIIICFTSTISYFLWTTTPKPIPKIISISPTPTPIISFPAVTLNSIFTTGHDLPISRNTNRLVTTGDVMLGRSVNYQSIQNKDFNWPFQNITSVMFPADLTFINLETPLVEKCPITNTGMIFCADNRHIEGLVSSGVDLANLANNHTLNYQQQGLDNTIKLLTENNISPVGTGSSTLEISHGTKFGFISFDDLAPKQNYAQLILDLTNQSDITIVAFHWGVEYTAQPTKRQIDLAHLAVDSGADLVIGNHPHWIQPIEIYKDKIIIYSHGNLIFDQMWSEKTKQGIISRFTFSGKTLVDLEIIPIVIEKLGQPSIAEGQDKQVILSDLYQQSLILAQNLTKNP